LCGSGPDVSRGHRAGRRPDDLQRTGDDLTSNDLPGHDIARDDIARDDLTANDLTG